MKILKKLSNKVKRIVHDEWVEIKSCDIFKHHEEDKTNDSSEEKKKEEE